MAADDQAAFLACIDEASKPESLLKSEPAEHLRMQLQDATGSKVMMDLHIIQCMEVDGGVGFFIGVSEMQTERTGSEVPCMEGNQKHKSEVETSTCDDRSEE